jgi:hypothetical protein
MSDLISKEVEWARNHRCPRPDQPGGHEFDAACGAVFGMRLHPDEHTDGDIVRAVVRELFYMDLPDYA